MAAEFDRVRQRLPFCIGMVKIFQATSCEIQEQDPILQTQRLKSPFP